MTNDYATQDYATQDDLWDVFMLDEETDEPDPERGDFWGELDDDCDYGG